MPSSEDTGLDRYEHLLAERTPRFARSLTWALGAVAVMALCWKLSGIDLARLAAGLPRLLGYLAKGWPPNFEDFDAVLRGAGETIAIATLGTSFGAVLAVPLCLAGARNITPSLVLHAPARALLNILRSIDTFVFALLFVAAVGLGPFAGVLGVALHVAGSIAKLWSEEIESVDPRPIEALTATGASRLLVWRYGLLPTVAPGLVSVLLYMWEFNIRSSTVLGLVGAGGIGQQLKNAVDLLDFARVVPIIGVILAMVALVDGLSALLRRRLVAP